MSQRTYTLSCNSRNFHMIDSCIFISPSKNSTHLFRKRDEFRLKTLSLLLLRKMASATFPQSRKLVNSLSDVSYEIRSQDPLSNGKERSTSFPGSSRDSKWWNGPGNQVIDHPRRPRAVSGGVKKSKRARKKIGRRKVKNEI